jgi:N-acetyl-beta-hexosaminidase
MEINGGLIFIQAYPECWLSSPEIAEFMKVNGYTNVSQVQEHYTTRHVEMVKSLGAMPISWQDPLDAGVKVSNDDDNDKDKTFWFVDCR